MVYFMEHPGTLLKWMIWVVFPLFLVQHPNGVISPYWKKPVSHKGPLDPRLCCPLQTQVLVLISYDAISEVRHVSLAFLESFGGCWRFPRDPGSPNVRWARGVVHHLWNARYLGSMKPLSGSASQDPWRLLGRCFKRLVDDLLIFPSAPVQPSEEKA